MNGGWQSPACVPLPADDTFKAYVRYCTVFTPRSPSWWTLDHIGALCAIAALIAAFAVHWLAARHALPDEEPGNGGTPAEINTAYYLDMAARKPPVEFGGHQ